MSQPPKSTMRAPAVRWVSFSGVFDGTRSGLQKRKGPVRAMRLTPLSLVPERLRRARRAPLRWTARAAALQSPEILSGSARSFCLRVCGCFPFGGAALRGALSRADDALSCNRGGLSRRLGARRRGIRASLDDAQQLFWHHRLHEMPVESRLHGAA